MVMDLLVQGNLQPLKLTQDDGKYARWGEEQGEMGGQRFRRDRGIESRARRGRVDGRRLDSPWKEPVAPR